MTELLERLAADVGGRYVVERELGRGGMATVYLARDLLDERQVAIKVMDPELAAAVGAERFKREIEVVSRLQHPHILGILASGEAAGTSYYVMPFVKGESLRDRLARETQLPVEDAIRIAREVAAALEYAHERGVVHRDIKPENILLEDGRALVADFGIARAASEGDNSTLTKTGTALGTPHYMSPEQVMGEKHDIDGRTDQYALGCMLYEMLAGQPPFVGPHAQSLMAQHVLDPPPFVTRFRASTPTNVEDAIITTLAKNKVDRFPTMRDLTVALENTGYTSMMAVARRNTTMTGMQATPVKQPVPLWKRAAIAAVALLLLIGATAGAWSFVKGTTMGRLSTDEAVQLRRVAVLYLKADRIGDLPLIADAVTEGVIARLRTVGALTVSSRNAVAPLRDTQLGADSVARMLDVGALVTGSVSREGGGVRVDVQLRNAAGTELTSLTVTDTAGGPRFAESLADSVALRLRQMMGNVGRDIDLKARRQSTENLSAWTTFQRGQQHRSRVDSLLAVGGSPAVAAALDSADARFAEAARLDAAWSAPLVGRGFVAVTRARLVNVPAQSAPWLDSAEAIGTAALAIDDTDPDAYELRGTARADRLRLGLVATSDAQSLKDLAEADLTQSTRLNPTQASAWSTLSRLAYSGRDRNAAQAKSLAQKAYEADAYLADARSVLFRLFITSHDLDQYPDAKKYCDEGHRRFPHQAMFTGCQLMVLTMVNATPQPGEAWRLVQSLKGMTSAEDWPLESRMNAMYVAVALLREAAANPARQRQLTDSARRVVEQARGDKRIDPTDELLGREAFVLAQLGDTEAAIDLIARYLSAHPTHVDGFKTGSFWGWAPLRRDPRYQKLTGLAN